MALLLPTVAVETLLDVTPELLASMGVDTVLLDVDNTLACLLYTSSPDACLYEPRIYEKDVGNGLYLVLQPFPAGALE